MLLSHSPSEPVWGCVFDRGFWASPELQNMLSSIPKCLQINLSISSLINKVHYLKWIYKVFLINTIIDMNRWFFFLRKHAHSIRETQAVIVSKNKNDTNIEQCLYCLRKNTKGAYSVKRFQFARFPSLALTMLIALEFLSWLVYTRTLLFRN